MAARLLAVAGAVLMPVSLFLDWYEVEPRVFAETGFTFDGWAVFEATDAVVVLAAIAALALVVMAPAYGTRALMVVGGIATGFIVVELIDKPAILGLFDTPGLSLEIGAWLGLLGALLILAAGVLSSQAGLRASISAWPGRRRIVTRLIRSKPASSSHARTSLSV